MSQGDLRRRIQGGAAALAVGAAWPASLPAQASATASVSAQIVSPASIQPLETAAAAPASVAVRAQQVAVSAAYAVGGPRGLVYSLDLSPRLPVARVGGAERLVAELAPSGALVAADTTRTAAGVRHGVAGRLNIAPDAVPGVYKGTVTVVANFN